MYKQLAFIYLFIYKDSIFKVATVPTKRLVEICYSTISIVVNKKEDADLEMTLEKISL